MVKIGSSDLDVSRLCLGGNVFGWTADEQVQYLLRAPGVAPAWTASQLVELCDGDVVSELK